MPPSWQNLPDSADSFEAELMIRRDITRSKYTIHVTNLRHIWVESLDAEQIHRRAADLGTSIDPSEDAEQLAILLEKLKASLEGCQGSVLHIVEGEDGHLKMRSTTPLPAGLAALQWIFHLRRQAEDAVRDEILRPLLRASHMQKVQIRHLTALLAEKDAGITKVLEKLESSNVDIHSIFPNVSKGKIKGKISKKVSSREQLALRIPGLATFDLQAWANTSRDALHEAMTFRELVSGAFESEPASVGFVDSLAEDMDTKSLQGPSRDGASSQRVDDLDFNCESVYATQLGRTDTKQLQMPSPATNDDETTDDDFDVRSHPIGGGSQHARTANEASFPDEGISASHVSPARSAVKKLGTIGGRKNLTFGSQTPASSQDLQPDPPQVARACTPARQTGDQMSQILVTPPSRKRLGHIGGRSVADDTLKFESQGSPSKYGRGASQLSPSRFDKAQVPATEPATNESSIIEQAEESTQARADRKRDELKRQLEASGKTGGKKKRKF